MYKYRPSLDSRFLKEPSTPRLMNESLMMRSESMSIRTKVARRRAAPRFENSPGAGWV